MPPIRPRPTHPQPRPATTPAAHQPGDKPAEGKGGDEYPDKPAEGKTGEGYAGKTAEATGRVNFSQVWEQLAEELIAGNADVIQSSLNLDADQMRQALQAVADQWGGEQQPK